MLKNKKFFQFALGLSVVFFSILFIGGHKAMAAPAQVPMYRVYNRNNGEHFYTKDTYEKGKLIDLGWQDEGVGWYAPTSSATPVFRLYNANAGDHHYTVDKYERDHLIRLGWQDEGVGWYSGGTIPLHRSYNVNAKAGSHHYTTNKSETENLNNNGWAYEGISWYASRAGHQTVESTALASRNAAIEKAIAIGMSYVGNGSWVWGAGRTTASIQARQFDCSAFVNWCYVSAGINTGDQSVANTWSLWRTGRPIAYEDKQRGDILLMPHPATGDLDHAAIYLGDNKILHCSLSAANGAQNIAVDDLSSVCKGLRPRTWEELFRAGYVRRVG